MNLKPNFAFICINTSLNPSRFNSPFVTSVFAALKPKHRSASSSFPIQTSTNSQSPVITSLAFSLVHNFLRKFKSMLVVMPLAFAAFSAASVSAAALSLNAGVIPVV